MLIHENHPAVPDRWGYHLRTLEAGRLLDEPIPQIAFGPPDNKVFSLLHDWSQLIGRDWAAGPTSAPSSTGWAGAWRSAERCPGWPTG
jgi:hypothetical protein